MIEEWRKINGFENYEISNLGRIRRFYIKSIKYRKPVLQLGYHTVTFSSGNNIFNKFKVHRLVALSFIDNPLNKRCVNHINGVKIDNRVENLEWCTHSENEKHSFEILGKKSNGIVRRKIELKDIDVIKEMSLNKVTQRKIAEIYNVSQTVISLIINNKSYQKWI
jgi:hypothetical protein